MFRAWLIVCLGCVLINTVPVTQAKIVFEEESWLYNNLKLKHSLKKKQNLEFKVFVLFCFFALKMF